VRRQGPQRNYLPKRVDCKKGERPRGVRINQGSSHLLLGVEAKRLVSKNNFAFGKVFALHLEWAAPSQYEGDNVATGEMPAIQNPLQTPLISGRSQEIKPGYLRAACKVRKRRDSHSGESREREVYRRRKKFGKKKRKWEVPHNFLQGRTITFSWLKIQLFFLDSCPELRGVKEKPCQRKRVFSASGHRMRLSIRVCSGKKILGSTVPREYVERKRS